MVFTISYKVSVMTQNFNNVLNKGMIEKNSFLSRNIIHYWRHSYVRVDYGNSSVDGQISDDIRTLKNQFCDKSISILQCASQRIEKDISEGLDILLHRLAAAKQPWVVVAVPRSKATFCKDQLYLIKAISDAVPQYLAQNGAYFIKRHTDTKTTHLMNTKNGDMNKTGDAPYPGITGKTCSLHGNVNGKNVILIDDIYTYGVNIDEDCAQFLFDNGARNVVLYTLCKT